MFYFYFSNLLNSFEWLSFKFFSFRIDIYYFCFSIISSHSFSFLMFCFNYTKISMFDKFLLLFLNLRIYENSLSFILPSNSSLRIDTFVLNSYELITYTCNAYYNSLYFFFKLFYSLLFRVFLRYSRWILILGTMTYY